MPITRAFISPEEVIPGRVVTYEELAAIASSLNRGEAMHFLGFLNLLLASATLETSQAGALEPVRDVQTHVFREVVSETLLAALKAKFRDASLLDRPILHRTQLLFAIRLIATHGQAEGGNTLATRADFDAIGDLLFLINGLFRIDTPRSKASTAVWVATQTGPLFETENPLDLSLAWPRIHDLLTNRVPAAATDPAELERLERVALFTSGFGVEAWLDLTYMLFSFWSAVTFRDLMANRGRGYLDATRDHDLISRETLSRALEGLGISFDEVPAQLRIDAFSRATLFDLTPFRTKPLWVMPDGRVLCVDHVLLMERLGAHVFWNVMNALDTSERRLQFTSTWGTGFENYCLDALATVFRSKKWTFVPNALDKDLNEELSDGIAVRNGVAILIECKGTFIRSADKYSGTPRSFFRGLSQKFGCAKHAGIYQLARAITRLWFSRTAKSDISGLSDATEVFPVLVVQDPIFHCGPVGRVLSDRLITSLSRRHVLPGLKAPKVWPLTVLTADDVDRLSAAVRVSGARIDAFLKGYHRAHPSRMIPVGEFFSERGSDYFRPWEQVRASILDRFKSTAEQTMERFKAAEYGGRPGGEAQSTAETSER